MKVETWHWAITHLLSELSVLAIKARNTTHQKDLPAQFKYHNVVYAGTDKRLLLGPLFYFTAVNILKIIFVPSDKVL